MKRILVMFCAFAAMLAGTVSCEEPETGYEGINYIYLDASSDSMYDTEDASIKVTATLTTAIDQNLTLMFEVNDPDGIITLEGNPVTIAAGETTAAFTVTTKEIPDISASFRITLSDDTVLPENVQWDEDFLFTVKTSAVSDLTEDQIAIIESYRETTGIDLSKYLGFSQVQ